MDGQQTPHGRQGLERAVQKSAPGPASDHGVEILSLYQRIFQPTTSVLQSLVCRSLSLASLLPPYDYPSDLIYSSSNQLHFIKCNSQSTASSVVSLRTCRFQYSGPVQPVIFQAAQFVDADTLPPSLFSAHGKRTNLQPFVERKDSDSSPLYTMNCLLNVFLPRILLVGSSSTHVSLICHTKPTKLHTHLHCTGNNPCNAGRYGCLAWHALLPSFPHLSPMQSHSPSFPVNIALHALPFRSEESPCIVQRKLEGRQEEKRTKQASKPARSGTSVAWRFPSLSLPFLSFPSPPCIVLHAAAGLFTGAHLLEDGGFSNQHPPPRTSRPLSASREKCHPFTIRMRSLPLLERKYLPSLRRCDANRAYLTCNLNILSCCRRAYWMFGWTAVGCVCVTPGVLCGRSSELSRCTRSRWGDTAAAVRRR